MTSWEGCFRAAGRTLHVIRTEYTNNGRMAIELRDRERPFATLSVNLPDEPEPPENCFWAKTWSENGPLRQPALESGLFLDTGKRVQTGFVQAELWRLV